MNRKAFLQHSHTWMLSKEEIISVLIIEICWVMRGKIDGVVPGFFRTFLNDQYIRFSVKPIL